MKKREYLIFGLVMIIAIFAVVGHMPTLLADGNDSNKSGNGSDSGDNNISLGNNSDNHEDNSTSNNKDTNKIESTGTIQFVDVEGGCWKIVAKNGVNYEPTNLNDKYKQNGTIIKFKGNLVSNVSSTCQVGTLIKLSDIEMVETNNNTKTQNKSKAGCTIKIERKVEIDNGKRIETVTKKMKCADGREAEVKINLANSTENGKFKERIQYQFKGQNHEVEAEDGINVSEDTNGTDYHLRARLMNGNFTDIKIMPDQASEIALARLKALNFTVELREKIHKNIPRVVYLVDANKSGRFLGVFKFVMKTNAQIDPQTGEVLSVNAPWWAFLVAQQDETVIADGNQTNGSG